MWDQRLTALDVVDEAIDSMTKFGHTEVSVVRFDISGRKELMSAKHVKDISTGPYSKAQLRKYLFRQIVKRRKRRTAPEWECFYEVHPQHDAHSACIELVKEYRFGFQGLVVTAGPDLGAVKPRTFVAATLTDHASAVRFKLEYDGTTNIP